MIQKNSTRTINLLTTAADIPAVVNVPAVADVPALADVFVAGLLLPASFPVAGVFSVQC